MLCNRTQQRSKIFRLYIYFCNGGFFLSSNSAIPFQLSFQYYCPDYINSTFSKLYIIPTCSRNRSVICFWWLLCVVTLLFGFFCGCRGSCHRNESGLILFLLISCYKNTYRHATKLQIIHFENLIVITYSLYWNIAHKFQL